MNFPGRMILTAAAANPRRQAGLRRNTEGAMASRNLEVFEKTLQVTDQWLDELSAQLGPDRRAAWHALGAVLRVVRDRVPVGLAGHVGAQLPLLVRGAYYEHFNPLRDPDKTRDLDGFLANVGKQMPGVERDGVWQAVRAVFAVLGRHLTPEQAAKLREALPAEVQAVWPEPGELQLRPAG
jgi:uncharacterized protein (DUF2267 family)